MITDVLIASPIINVEEEGMGGAGAAGAGAGAAGVGAGGPGASQFAEYGGIDPNLDPELAMALRISLEEERARQQPVGSEAQEQVQAAPNQATEVAQQVQQDLPKPDVSAQVHDEDEEMDDEAILQQAMMLSMQAGQPTEGQQ